jgi:hypothetical protein
MMHTILLALLSRVAALLWSCCAMAGQAGAAASPSRPELWLSGEPKSGTSWTQMTIYLVRKLDNPDEGRFTTKTHPLPGLQECFDHRQKNYSKAFPTGHKYGFEEKDPCNMLDNVDAH